MEQYEYMEQFFEGMVVSDEAVTFDNYFLHTKAYFSFTKNHPKRDPDYISYKKYRDNNDNLVITSEISSRYWFEGEFVIRSSDHWSYRCGIASCWWELHKSMGAGIWNYDILDEGTGFCKLSDFEKFKYEGE